MMFCDGHYVFRARIFEKLNPLIGIKVFALEHGNEILVTEYGRISEVLFVEFILVRSGVIHPSRIPFACISGNAVDAPVYEDSELSFIVPGRYLMTGQGRPVSLISAVCYRIVYEL